MFEHRLKFEIQLKFFKFGQCIYLNQIYILSRYLEKEGIQFSSLNKEEMELKEKEFYKNEYPGLPNGPISLVNGMTNTDPDSLLEAEVYKKSKAGCYDSAALTKSLFFKCISLGYTLPSFQYAVDDTWHACYFAKKLRNLANFEDANTICAERSGRLMDFYAESETKHISAILGRNNVKLIFEISQQLIFNIYNITITLLLLL